MATYRVQELCGAAASLDDMREPSMWNTVESGLTRAQAREVATGLYAGGALHVRIVDDRDHEHPSFDLEAVRAARGTRLAV